MQNFKILSMSLANEKKINKKKEIILTSRVALMRSYMVFDGQQSKQGNTFLLSLMDRLRLGDAVICMNFPCNWEYHDPTLIRFVQIYDSNIASTATSLQSHDRALTEIHQTSLTWSTPWSQGKLLTFYGRGVRFLSCRMTIIFCWSDLIFPTALLFLDITGMRGPKSVAKLWIAISM